jgi:pimeloyl-ACP methyl ester carboxylesterase
MKTNIFSYKKMHREYQILGNGSRVLYAFHGFGGSFNDWTAFDSWLYSDFTVFSFHDVYHGKSSLIEDSEKNNFLEKKDIVSFFSAFAEENKHLNVNLMAYSSGARTALTLLENPPFIIEETFLFAADGIKISSWNKLFIKWSFVQRIFKYTIEHPNWFFQLVKRLNKMGLLNSNLTSFVLLNMRSRNKRELIYNYWLVYKEIIPSMAEVFRSIRQNNIQLHLIFAFDDAVIDSKIGVYVQRELDENIDILLLEGGHQLLTKGNLKQVEKRFRRK